MTELLVSHLSFSVFVHLFLNFIVKSINTKEKTQKPSNFQHAANSEH